VDKQTAKEGDELTKLKKKLEKIDYACFPEGTDSVSARELRGIYKDQHMLVSNFGLLKDPVFVNALVLKSPRRIEAFGLLLVLALMVYTLMEPTMRAKLRSTDSTITGWENRKTFRPTTLMAPTKFVGIFVFISGLSRRLSQPFNEIQLRYLKILKVRPKALLNPLSRHLTQGE
jgi:transposase